MTRPGSANLLVVAAGWVLCCGPGHTITEAWMAAAVAGQSHWEALHRLFSRGDWSPGMVGYARLQVLRNKLGDGPLQVVLDDTLVAACRFVSVPWLRTTPPFDGRDPSAQALGRICARWSRASATVGPPLA